MRSLILTTLIALLMVGCSDFGDLNTDPNNPAQPRTDLLLTEAEKTMGGVVGSVTPTLYVQYFSETQYTEASRYSEVNFDWDAYYSDALFDLQTIIDLNTNEDTKDASYVLAGGSNANQLAVARILKTYYFSILTDRFNYVPYSEALQGNEDLTPKYDSQQDVYSDMLQKLKSAANNIAPGQTAPSGDFIFEGDMEKWRRFANTLRMRLALRLVERNASTAQTHFMEAYNNGFLEESAMYPFLASANNENPWYSRFETRTDYAISNTIANPMKDLDDMRLTKFAEPAPNYDDGDGTVELSDINPMPYGVGEDSAGGISNAEVSFPGEAVKAQGADLPIISMAEVHFMLAEAAARGWGVSGSAEAHYESGIEASWRQWGVYDQTDFQAYINQPEVQYDSNNWRESIGYEKWIALFPYGYEAWAEWRRLGQPNLDPAPAAFENRDVPVRQGYPGSEPDLNRESYNSAIQSQGGGSFSPLESRVWWDTTPNP